MNCFKTNVFIKSFARFLRDSAGATSIEYGLIASLISIIAIGAISTIGEATANNVFTAIAGFLG